MDHANERDPALEMSPEVRRVNPVLRSGPSPNAVREDCFQDFELAAAQARATIDDYPGEMLPRALAHDASLAVVDMTTFLQGDCRGVRSEAIGRARIPLRLKTPDRRRSVCTLRPPISLDPIAGNRGGTPSD